MDEKLDMSDLAQLAELAYQPYNTTKRKWLGDISPHYKLDNELTNKYIAVAYDQRNNDVFVSHRGTKLNDLSDLSADLAIIGGKESMHKRFKEADAHIQKVKDKYGKGNIILASHSLGGALSSHVAKKHDLEAHVFNAGSNVLDVRGNIKKKVELKVKPRKNKIIHYTTGKDIISAGFVADETREVGCKKKSLNCHSIDHFIGR